MFDLQLNTPITLKCGLTLPNRLAKAPLAEQMAEKFMPTAAYKNLYRLWADGGWGMVITGNVQVDVRHTGQFGDVAFEESIGHDKLVKSWKECADIYRGKKTAFLMQVNHAGRQAARGAGRRSIFTPAMAPSPLPLKIGTTWFSHSLWSLAFGTPREMNHQDIAEVVRLFRDAALTAYEAGFSGVEIHGAHGYLLSQFLSSKTNIREDEYGGTPAKRARIVVEVIRAIKEAVPTSFCVGIKLNSVDHQSHGDLAACLEQLELIIAAEIDFIEISGGDYEQPLMVTGETVEKSARTKDREAFFLDFSKEVRAKYPNVPLMVTGGFQRRRKMEAAIAGGHCDLVGLGRPAILDPALPRNTILNAKLSDQEATLYREAGIQGPWISRVLGLDHYLGAATLHASAENNWYVQQMRKISREHRGTSEVET